MRTLLCFLMLAALAGVALADVDVTGKWSGSFNATNPNGETKESTALLMLKQTGTDITAKPPPASERGVQKSTASKPRLRRIE